MLGICAIQHPTSNIQHRPEPRAWSITLVLLSFLAIGLVALLARVLDLGLWISGDEANFWLRRSDLFWRAVRSGNFAATAISTHPGVTTMWLGTAGQHLADVLFESGLVRDYSFPSYLGLVRLPTALVHVAGVLLGYWLLRRLFAPAVAALAALFWAADPFVIAFSRALHVDALPATFIALSVLAAGCYWYTERRPRWMVLSGVWAGLAILSKSPALALLPVMGALALLETLRAGMDAGRARSVVLRASYTLFVVPLLIWGVTCTATIVALWPALWVAPAQAIHQVFLGVEAEGAEPHMLGNFFLGQQDDSPGLLFYPVALAMRLTPWTLCGLLVLPFVLRPPTADRRPADLGFGIWDLGFSPLTADRRRTSDDGGPPSDERRATSGDVQTHGHASVQTADDGRRTMAALALFVVVFVAAMSLFPKKFNRYLVPVFPLLDILAAVGIIGAVRWMVGVLAPWPKLSSLRVMAVTILMSGVALLAVANAVWYHPYSIVYYNQALGGAQVGARTFVTGWGEGLSEAAIWLNQQPDITGVLTVSTLTSPLQPYMRRGAQTVRLEGDPLPAGTGYVVVYTRNVQWGKLWEPFDQFYGRATPLHTVSIHGIPYAWIYQAPPPVAQPLQAGFGNSIRLHGFEPAQAPGQSLSYRLSWDVLSPPPTDYMLFAHLIGPDGRRYAQVDLQYPASQWQPGRFVWTDLTLPVPPDLPPGVYQLYIGLYDLPTSRRLPLTSTTPEAQASGGPDALLLTTVRLP